MYNIQKVALVAMLSAALALAIGTCFGALLFRQVYRDAAIRLKFAEYDDQTGSWKWRAGMRQPLRNDRGWIVCPFCRGSGEFSLDDFSQPDACEPTSENPVLRF